MLVLFIISSTLIGCAKTVSGTFIHEKNSKEYLELKSDNTFFLQQSGGATGKYTIDGNTLTLDYGGPADRAVINGNTITESDGEKWIKK